MPLIKSASRQAIASNIREMEASGRPKRVALAAALHTADEAGSGKMERLKGKARTSAEKARR